MEEKNVIAKIGGSILISQDWVEHSINQLEMVLQKCPINNIILIFGGGMYANFVRQADKFLKLGDDLAHWLAILAMDYNSFGIAPRLWAKGYKSVIYVGHYNKLLETLKIVNKKIIIYGSFSELHENDPLPHKWDVTSDSITYHFAKKLDMKRCFLIKDVNGILDKDRNLIKKISTKEYRYMKEKNMLYSPSQETKNIKKSQPIDNYLLNLIDEHKIPCHILNGKPPHTKILDYFKKSKEEKKLYTKIYH